jgi:hypothetical protein
VTGKDRRPPSSVNRYRRVGRTRQIGALVALSMALTMLPVFNRSLWGAVTPPSPPGRSAPSEASGDQGRWSRSEAVRAPASRDELWARVVRLLNESGGAVTKARVEAVLGVRLTLVSRDREATIYGLKSGESGPFDARVTVWSDRFTLGLPSNRAHSEWALHWDTAWGGDVQHACVTAERVRADLLATGWTSPWRSWGFWEERRRQIAQDLQAHAPPGGYVYPPMMPEPRAAFWRGGDDNVGHRDRLPEGVVFGTGDFSDSCITAIRVTAGL